MFKFPNRFVEILGWIRIFLSPFLLGFIIALLIYFLIPGKTGFIISITVASSGLILGIIWATRIWRKNGTINFLSNISTTPELDKQTED